MSVTVCSSWDVVRAHDAHTACAVCCVLCVMSFLEMNLCGWLFTSASERVGTRSALVIKRKFSKSEISKLNV